MAEFRASQRYLLRIMHSRSLKLAESSEYHYLMMRLNYNDHYNIDTLGGEQLRL